MYFPPESSDLFPVKCYLTSPEGGLLEASWPDSAPADGSSHLLTALPASSHQ